jgi:uncharacterized protein
MLKFVIIAVAVVLLVWLLLGRNARADKPAAGVKRDRRADASAEEMVSCAHCGVHLPRSEAIAVRSLHYCSAAHRDAAPPAP